MRRRSKIWGEKDEGLDKTLPSSMAMSPKMVQIEGRFDGDDGWEWKCENEHEEREREMTPMTTM